MNARKAPIVLAPSSEFFKIMLEAFERAPDARVAFTTSGTSMFPMLRDRKDVVYLRKLEGGAKKYDVVLFRRCSGEYVLHRVVGIEPDGTYVFCGDNQVALERGVKQEQMLAVVEAFRRSGILIDCRRSILYYCYSRAWPNARFLRRARLAVLRRVRWLFGRRRTKIPDKK